VAETGQPYAFTADDPLNAADPLGDLATNQFGEGCGPSISYCHETPARENSEEPASAVSDYIAAATTAMCGCSGNPATIFAKSVGHAIVHHPVQAGIFAFTAFASAPLDETGIGEGLDDAEASAFAADDAAQADEAEQIANGHAWVKHAPEFPEFSSPSELAGHILDV
jgi:hypothetical protein